MDQNFGPWQTLSKATLRSKIGLVVKRFLGPEVPQSVTPIIKYK